MGVNSMTRAITKQKFFNKNMAEIGKKSVEFENDKEGFERWYEEEFQKYIKENNLEYLFEENNGVEVVSAEELPTTALVLGENNQVIDVDSSDIQSDEVVERMKSVINKVADSLESQGIIEPKKPVTKGLVFDHLVVKDPEAAAAVDNGAHTIKVEENQVVQTTLFDNSKIISAFPDMGRIQEIIRTTEGWDVEMIPLYNDFIVCTLYVDGAVTNKVFIVDYKGEFMNNLPKIFLINGGFVDESEVIHLSDALNLINYLKGVQITATQEEIVTPEQRKIARYIVNYGTPKVHDKFRNKFETICVEKVLPFIETQILPSYPDASFAIDSFKDSTHWNLSCTPNIPYRFGESGGACKSIIYIHAEGLDKEGHLLVTPTFG